MESGLAALLLGTLDHRQSIRADAEQKLNEAKERSLGLFINELSLVLSSEENNTTIRQVAGLLLKNTISGKNKRDDEEKAAHWLALPADITTPTKQRVLEAIKCPYSEVSNAACQVISKLGRIELPTNRWPGFLDTLLAMVTEDVSEAKKAALTCLAYLSEEVAEILEEFNIQLLSEEQNDKILVTVVQGMTDSNPVVKVAASKAFYHCVIFAEKNFDKADERNFLFQVITENCKNEDTDVKMRSFECLVQIVTEYYSYMGPYMTAIFPLTIDAINEGTEQVAIPALEFWNSICDEEISIDCGVSKKVHQHFVQQALQYLLPILLETLTKQESEDEEMESMTLAKSAGICVSLCAQVVRDAILQYTLEFVNQNFSNEDWKRREAAVLAYGSIMEGPRTETIRPIVEQSFFRVCIALRDDSEAVRDTAAWTIGRIVSFHASVVFPLLGNPSNPDSPISLIVGQLKDTPRVAVNVCWIINEMAAQLGKSPVLNAEGGGSEYTLLDPLFQSLCHALIEVSERLDADEKNLREAAFNTLITLIEGVGDGCKPAMFKLYEHFLILLERSFAYERNQRLHDLQGLMCGCLQVLMTRLDVEMRPFFKKTWDCLATVLKLSANDGLSEDALLAVSALANVVEADFEPCMDELLPYLLSGLHRTEDLSTCKICIELVGDVSRALKGGFSRHSRNLMKQLHATLGDPEADRKLKPAIMVAIGDVAMAINGDFERLLLPFMQLLTQAAGTLIEMGPVDNEEWLWYITDLREGVLQAYSGIVYGMKDGGKKDVLQPYVNSMLELVQLVVNTDEAYFSETNLSSAIALTGDLVNTYEKDICGHLQNAPFVKKMISKAVMIEDDGTSEAVKDCKNKAHWLRQVLAHYSSNPSIS